MQVDYDDFVKTLAALSKATKDISVQFGIVIGKAQYDLIRWFQSLSPAELKIVAKKERHRIRYKKMMKRRSNHAS